jgi:hypothetical protein
VYPHWQEDNPRDFKWFRRTASMSPSQRRLSGRGLPVATADTGKLTSAALHGIAVWKQGYRYKKAGVIFLDLRPATEVQGTLFDQPPGSVSRPFCKAARQPVSWSQGFSPAVWWTRCPARCRTGCATKGDTQPNPDADGDR